MLGGAFDRNHIWGEELSSYGNTRLKLAKTFSVKKNNRVTRAETVSLACSTTARSASLSRLEDTVIKHTGKL